MTLDRLSRFPMRTLPSRLAVAGVAASLLLVPGCSKQQDARGRPPVPVLVTRVRKSDVPYTIEANGVVTPLQAVSVNAQVEGIIQRVAFREGQDVVKGQLLFEIDSRPYRAAYQQAVANLARDRANAENAQLESRRYAALAQQDYVTREQADQQRANAASTAANVAASQAAVASAKFNLDNTAIRAPISGRTGALLVREGNVVRAAGVTPLVIINQVSPILVRFAIPSTQLPLLQRYGTGGGLVVQATPNTGTASSVDSNAAGPIGLTVGGDPGQSSDGGIPGSTPAPALAASSQLVALTQPENGSLFFIDNAVDTTTGTVLLKASFPNPNRRLWVGEFVTAKLELFVEQNALVVPATAVVTGQQGPYVYVVSDSMTVRQRSVTVERTAGSITVIAAGLRGGETIVSEGQSRLTPNAKVVINTPQGTTAGGGAGGRRGGRGPAGGTAGPGGPGGAAGAGSGARPGGAPAGGGAPRGAGGQAPPAR
jgi:multidrug efflux system membrane fusion protein